jgi:hypothetical protein
MRCAAKPTIVESRCDQNAGDPKPGQRGDVPCVAHAARGIDADSPWRGPQDRLDAGKIRSTGGSHARQAHDDDLERPSRHVIDDLRRSEKDVVAKIEGQHHFLSEGAQQRSVTLTFGTKHQPPEAFGTQRGGRRRRTQAGVDPQRQIGKGRRQAAYGDPVVGSPFDRIEIGHVKASSRNRAQKAVRNVHRIGGLAERRDDGRIKASIAPSRPHDFAAAQVDHRDDFNLMLV